MNKAIKNMLLDALALKEASIKRAQNTSKNPRLKEVYDIEYKELYEARAWVNAQKETA